MELYQWLPLEGVKILLVLFLSFLIGLDREEHKSVAGSYLFGGVRTFPLIGLIGYSIALLSGAQLLPVVLGFLVVGGFLLLSYWHKLSRLEGAGVGIRVIKDGRQGFAYVGDLDERHAREALEEARDNASFASIDEHVGLATPDGVADCYLTKPAQWDAFEELVKSINDFWLTKVKLPQQRQH